MRKSILFLLALAMMTISCAQAKETADNDAPASSQTDDATASKVYFTKDILSAYTRL